MSSAPPPPRVSWPGGKTFAFTVFDDTDSQTFECAQTVYEFLADLGLRTTKSMWVLPGSQPPQDPGACGEGTPEYVAWLQGLLRRGFEIALHTAAPTTSTRAETLRAFERFAEWFGQYPQSFANHYASRENIYFGDARLTGGNRLAYNLLTGFRNRNQFSGHVEGDPLYWGDACRRHVRYVRNFVFPGINTLAECPWMPYHDPARPLVNHWFASTEGAAAPAFLERLSEQNQDRLESQGGACIMYTHFGLGFRERGELVPRFRQLMQRLSRKDGWFVPVTTLLDHLLKANGSHVISPAERSRLEHKWLIHKLLHGSA